MTIAPDKRIADVELAIRLQSGEPAVHAAYANGTLAACIIADEVERSADRIIKAINGAAL